MSSPEIQKGGSEFGAESQKAAGERLNELHEKLEKNNERGEDHGEKLESARKETEAAFSKESGKEHGHGGEPNGPVTHATKKQRQKNYESTMQQIRSEMSVSQRNFSKFIHNKAVERTSEIVGNTIARPNAVLSGSICATSLTLAIFLVAKYYGYPLSGFETIAAFLFGWLLGIIYDYLRIMITGKPN